ncbi:MAG: hypothetical protein KKG75_03720 [Nanoarchaeota archaeon]|nr:hypothetical protein [Nanoarchaeota archaeon]
MANERKIRCDCGGYLKERTIDFDSVKTKAMVCSKCNFTTLTKTQAKEYIRLKQLHQIIDAERKIIKIGNSMGLILPDRLREFGVKIGTKVKTEATTPKSFKINLD